MTLLPVDDAIARITGSVSRLDAETVPLDRALGRVLAAPLAATREQPPFPASAMDGYAVRAADTEDAPAALKLIGVSAAGHGFAGSVGPGEAVGLSTGAPMPAGSDAVLIKENAEKRDDATVIANEPTLAGRHIRQPGMDFRQGDVLLTAGRRLGPREIALTAAMNHAAVPVRRRPRVAIIATGDELVRPGETPGPDQIVASNDAGLAAFVRMNGGEPHDLGITIDDRAAIGATIDAALKIPADVIVTLGGASVGDHDLVQAALIDQGMDLEFWRIAMRPGKPLMFGRLGDTRILGLPGNPVSSLVCALLFLKPLLDALTGVPIGDPTEPAILGSDLGENDDRQDYLRAALDVGDGLPKASALPVQDSSGLVALAKADCLIVRPPCAPAAKAGEACRIINLGRVAAI